MCIRDRFIGILIEHYAGALPTWLSPVQVKVLPISDKFADYADSVAAKLDEASVRAVSYTHLQKQLFGMVLWVYLSLRTLQKAQTL